VIAAVHGVAFGGGFQVCLGADIRLVTPDVKLSILEIKWGLVPDMAGMVLLRGAASVTIRPASCASPAASSKVTRPWLWAWRPGLR
jgi:hypothetical protein